ncbi:MAG: alpha/beta hydrolase, partial [Actinomycetota bacterium]|nr:alpha/beta hydrolase [Actinomycetota bacterium]
ATPPAGRSSTVVSNRNLIRRFLREQVRAPAVLVGNSMGGFLSLLTAAREPALVEGLVLVCAALPLDLRTKLDPVVTCQFALYLVPGLAEGFLRWRHRRLGPEGVLEEMMELCSVDRSRIRQEVYDEHLKMARERFELDHARPVFLEAARSLVPLLWRRSQLEALIRRVQAPALIVQGAKDRLAPVGGARRLVKLRPDWALEVFDDLGHVPQLEDPDRFLQVVGRWLEALPSRDAPRIETSQAWAEAATRER